MRELYKPPIAWCLESFRVGKQVEVLGGGTPGEAMDAPCPLPLPCPVHLFLALRLYPFLQ